MERNCILSHQDKDNCDDALSERVETSKTFSCKACNLLFKYYDELVIHVKSTHIIVDNSGEACCYRCALCKFKIKRGNRFRESHYLQEHTTERLKCAHCSFTTVIKFFFLRHDCSKQGGLKLLKCILCKYKCSKKDSLSSHIKLIHNGGKPFKCKKCSFKCTHKQALLMHMKFKHGKKKVENDEAEKSGYVDSESNCEIIDGELKSVELATEVTDHPFNGSDMLIDIKRDSDMPVKLEIETICISDDSLTDEVELTETFTGEEEVNSADILIEQRETNDSFNCEEKDKSGGTQSQQLQTSFSFHEKGKSNGALSKQQLNGRFSCDACNIVFKCFDELVKHVRCHHVMLVKDEKDSYYVCTSCEFKIKGRTLSRASHYLQEHTKERLKCVNCRFVTVRKASFLKHIRLKHNSIKLDDEEESCIGSEFKHSTLENKSKSVDVKPVTAISLDYLEDANKLAKLGTGELVDTLSEQVEANDILNHQVRGKSNDVVLREMKGNDIIGPQEKDKLDSTLLQQNKTNYALSFQETGKPVDVLSVQKKTNNILSFEGKSDGTLPEQQKNDTFICEACNVVFENWDDLVNHVRCHHIILEESEKGSYYRCPSCLFKIKGRHSSRASHYLQEHTKERLGCGQCGFATVVKAFFLKHIRLNHTGYNLFECILCSYKSPKKKCLSRHMKLMHNCYKPLNCKYCSFKSINKGCLSRHIKAKHNLKQPDSVGTKKSGYVGPDFICETVDDTFKSVELKTEEIHLFDVKPEPDMLVKLEIDAEHVEMNDSFGCNENGKSGYVLQEIEQNDNSSFQERHIKSDILSERVKQGIDGVASCEIQSSHNEQSYHCRKSTFVC